MATQQTVFYLNWSAAFIRRAVDEDASFYDRIEALDKDEVRTLCRQGLELAASLRQLLDALQLKPGHPLFETCDEFADRAETFALSLDPEVASSIDEARQEAREGRR